MINRLFTFARQIYTYSKNFDIAYTYYTSVTITFINSTVACVFNIIFTMVVHIHTYAIHQITPIYRYVFPYKNIHVIWIILVCLYSNLRTTSQHNPFHATLYYFDVGYFECILCLTSLDNGIFCILSISYE